MTRLSRRRIGTEHVVVLLGIIVGPLAGCDTVEKHAGDGIPLGELEERLIEVTRETEEESPFGEEALWRDPMVRRVLQADRNRWLEMVKQAEFPLSAQLAFACIERESPELAFEAAIEGVLANERGVWEVYLPMLQKIEAAAGSAKELEVFTRIARAKKLPRKMVGVVVATLGGPFLEKWLLSSEEVEDVNPVLEAIAVDEVMANYPDGGAPVRVAGLLASYAEASGIPLLVYVKNAKQKDKGFENGIKRLLLDGKLDEESVVLLASTHRQYIRALDLVELGVPKRRRQLLEDLLSDR